MTTDDIETVIARALCKKYLHGDDPRFWGPQASSEMLAYIGGRLEREWPEFVGDARAVLAALKERGIVCVPEEPTQAMCECAATADVPWEYVETSSGQVVAGPFALELSGPNKIDRAKEIVAALYRAMIRSHGAG